MKVRMIGGIREINEKDPLCGLWLKFVQFPMVVTNYEATDVRESDQLTLYNEDELRHWADRAFGEMGYQIWDMEVPITDTHPAMELVSRKSNEYRRAAPSTPEARGERDAVLAAFDTLMVHLRASL